MIPGKPKAPTIRQLIKFKVMETPNKPPKKLNIASIIRPPRELAKSLNINDNDLPNNLANNATRIRPVSQYNIIILSPSLINYIA